MRMASAEFERFAGACALLTGVAGFLYTVAFVFIARAAPLIGAYLSWILLLAGGLLAIPALVGVYRRLRETDAGFALLAFMLGFAGAFGAAVHAAYELAVMQQPPAATGDLPNAIDPRGFLTFGVAGLALFVVGWLIGRGGVFARGLGTLAYVSGVLLLVIYLGRLIVVDATSPLILFPAGIEGFVVNPIWYVWLGRELWRPRPSS